MTAGCPADMSLTKDPKGLRSFRNPAGLQVNTKTQTGFFMPGIIIY
jgi:hypothetical protein